MHQFVSSAIFATFFILIAQANCPSLLAQDLDETLEDLEKELESNGVWNTLSRDAKLELLPSLKVLLLDMRDEPLLNPSKAYAKADEELRKRVRECVQSRRQIEEELLEKLTPFLSEETIDDSDLAGALVSVKKSLQNPSAIPNKLDLYIDLATAIESVANLDEFRGEYKSTADYRRLLDELKSGLIGLGRTPRSPIHLKNVGRYRFLLKEVGEADDAGSTEDLVSEIRELRRQPNLWIHISEELINEFVESSVPPQAKTEQFKECILGTTVCGTAEATAKASITLCDASDRAELMVNLDGETVANSIGYRKPIQIKSISVSPFIAKKHLAISDKSFTVGCASAAACTDTTICSIRKVGGPFLSDLVERIAWRSAHRQKPQAEAIASQKLERKVEAEFDEWLAGGQKFYEQRYRSLLRLADVAELKFNSTLDDLRIGAALASPKELAIQKGKTPDHSTKSDLTIRIHSSKLFDMGSKKLSRDTLDALLEELLSNLPGGENRLPADTPQLFKLILESMMKDGELNMAPDFGNLSDASFKNLPQLEFGEPIVDFATGWFTFHWQLQN